MDYVPRNQAPPKHSPLRRRYITSGLVVFISALIYYTTYRSNIPWPGYLLNLEWAHNPALSDLSLGSYPSFAFCLSFGLWAIALFSSRRTLTYAAIGSVFIVGLLLETTLGTFDKLDVVAAVVGTLIAAACTVLAPIASKTHTDNRGSHSRYRAKYLGLMSFALVFSSASHVTDHYYGENCVRYDSNGYCIEEAIQARAVYLSYSDLRSAITTEPARELSSVSRIYLYKNYLFINERNEGIHVIDNTTPTSPKQIGFIVIPGNTELSIRSDNLYADSYIDLVTLDVSDINNITEVSREESIFPYDARQNIPYNVELNETIDSTRGVVVGYR